MDLATATAVITTASAAVSLFDKVAGQIVRFINKTPELPGMPKDYKRNIRGVGEELQVEENGKVIQTITGADLLNLPSDYLEHIRTYERSVKQYYDVWKQVYPHRDDGSLIENAKVHIQLRDLALKMKADLAAIIDFLQSIGVWLDDHYMNYRDVIKRYEGDDK
jgi:uncharacterized protein YeeX (DUF496 family)